MFSILVAEDESDSGRSNPDIHLNPVRAGPGPGNDPTLRVAARLTEAVRLVAHQTLLDALRGDFADDVTAFIVDSRNKLNSVFYCPSSGI